ncbi:hypothetical protein VM98_24110 [Streptomyces rubellomurinus subsp. indigoferus]|nr:hypothetical protein VM98_24110 [Streptomyces rubellomurinus subsp. indigoferus]
MTGDRANAHTDASEGVEAAEADDADGGPSTAHQPGDPTPVPGGQVGPATFAVQKAGGCLGELVVETVGGILLMALTTLSLAATFYVAQALHRASAPGAYALAALGLLALVHGVRHLRRPEERRSRIGRITAAVTAVLGGWLAACVGYASFDAAFGLNIGL